MLCFVGSENPVKLNAVRLAVGGHWPDAQIRGFDVPSGVSSQPRTDEETRLGAENRAKRALSKGLASLDLSVPSSSSSPHASSSPILGVGLEGGVFSVGEEMWSTVWVAVVDQDQQVYVANGARLRLPDPIAAKIKSGAEMGPVMAELSGHANVSQKEGMIGVVTRNLVTRTEEYGNIAKLVIGLWYGSKE